MSEIKVVEVGDKWNSLIMLDEYNGDISICAGNIGKDGNQYKKWVHPSQGKGKPASEKIMPLGVSLGDQATAAKILREFADALEGNSGQTQSQQGPPAGQAGPPPSVPGDQIPF